MTPYQEILKQIADLSPTELRNLQAAIAAMASLTGTPTSAPVSIVKNETDNERWALDILATEAATFGEFISVGQLQRSSYIKEFRRNLPGLMTFLEEHTTTRNEQRALLRTGIRLWYRYRSDFGSPATARQFLQQGNVPAMLNMAFPGYIENRLLKIVTRVGE